MSRILTVLAVAAIWLAAAAGAQSVSGTVTDGEETIPGASVQVEDTYVGTTTDAGGEFSLDVDFSEGARTLVFSFTGYSTRRIEVDGPTDDLTVVLEATVLRGDDVVISASRVEESVLEAPVTIERVNAAQLNRQPQTELISSLERLKGVDVSRSSMLITSLSTRGFNSAKSERLVQLVDGFDYISPTLSLYTGNIAGVPEIDVGSVEIVYGANSALYGANAFNGVVLYQTRDPFQEQGLSVSARGGERSLYEVQGRWAQQIGDRFAYKVVGSYLEADDYISDNFSALTTIPGNFDDGTLRDPNDPRGADIVNRYGETGVLDETTPVAENVTLGDLGLEGDVFTPGFTENDLVEGEYMAQAIRLNADVGYLITDDIKATLSGRWADGNGIYQSSNRYAFDGIGGKSLAAKVEGQNWEVRALANDDKAGDTYDMGFLGAFMNLQPYQAPAGQAGIPQCEGLNYATCYATIYAGAFAQARQQGVSVEEAYAAADQATTGIYPTLGEERFENARGATLANDTPGQSPTFKSDGQIYDIGGRYNIDLPADVMLGVGGRYRQNVISSEGTLYSDGVRSPISDPLTGERATRDEITNYEYGGYLQLRRNFFDERLRLAAVGRFDDFQNFEARFSPRISGVVSLGAEREHNLRASYSQAFRQPAQLDQYISLDVGSILLLGNTDDGYEGFALENGELGGQISIDPLELEQVNTIEFGYKGLFGGVLADVSYYRSNYNNFIGTRRFFGREAGGQDLPPNPAELADGYDFEGNGIPVGNRTRVLQTWLNSDESVTSQGFLVGVEYQINRALVPSANYTWSDIEEVDDLIVGFNTPEHKFNVGLSGEIGNFSYGSNLRWEDTYFFAMPFAEGEIEQHTVIDLQGSYAFPQFGLTVLAGATNLTDSNSISAFGSAPIERRIYAGIRYNPDLGLLGL